MYIATSLNGWFFLLIIATNQRDEGMEIINSGAETAADESGTHNGGK